MTFDWDMLGAFALLWMAIVPTPGANSLLIVHLALTRGWRDVAFALAGNLLGIASYAAATLLGLALLLTAVPSVRMAVHLLGGLYLVWIGIRLVRTGLARRTDDCSSAQSRNSGPGSSREAFVQGILTAFSNVPALFFLASIFASVGILQANTPTRLAAIGIIIAGNGSYLSFLAWLMQRPAARRFYTRYQPAMEAGFGALFMLLGARLIVGELTGWR